MSSIYKKTDREKYEVKIVLLGEPSVGKTSLFERYISDTFTHTSKSSKNALYDDKVIVSADKKIKMQLMIWDTAGQEIYRSLASTYYKDADIIFFIYDITSPKTFKELHYWLQQVKESGPETCVKSILGNKCDRIDCETVNDEDAAKLAAANDAKFFLVSAKENISVSKVFEEAVVRLHPKLKVLFEPVSYTHLTLPTICSV
eukprot:TRINITY_DN13339_c0_g1_i1.p2 TRINITY_DN13339_c0_g1~~TRINITY_DN13339_c0_g1_i1.p2  ORF type:complete len:202 (-),score=67.16 TRINITY_DN13339_c0_g1_i1:34-639(-)